MDSTPVIDLTAAADSPPPRPGPAAVRPPSPASSSQEAPLVATSLTTNSRSDDAHNASAVQGGSESGLPARRIPYPANAASTPIDLTDDDIEYLGEHRLQLPQPHAAGNDARPAPGDRYSLMDRLRDVAGMPFSRHARQTASGSRLAGDSLRIVDEDPLRYSAAAIPGPGPAAVAAANARARRSAAGVGGNATVGDNTAAAGNPPAGLNARRNRQRVRSAYNASNFQQSDADPGEYYYRRVPPPPRAPRGGRRQRRVYEGMLANLENLNQQENGRSRAAYHGGDQYDDLDLDLPQGFDVAGLHRASGAGNAAGGMARGLEAIQQNIMELLGFGGGGRGDPLANMGFYTAQPAVNGNPYKRKVKAYSVKQSHPNFNKKKDGKDGFERDIVPPPEVEEEGEREQDVLTNEDTTLSAEEQLKKQDLPAVSTGASSIPASGTADGGKSGDNPMARLPLNKGKSKALELDIPVPNTTPGTSALDPNSEIPVLDLAHDSPNGSGSHTSSSLFSGKNSNSTRGTSVDQLDEPDKSKVFQAAPAEPPKPPTRTVRVPVCTSCSKALYLNQSTSGRPYVLVCGHVICRNCLDEATARFKKWNAEEANSGNKASKQDSSTTQAWKGARLKESFQEVDRSRSSTVADTSSDSKGKRRPKMRIGAPGSSTPSTGAAISRPPARATRTTGRRRDPGPSYPAADVDADGDASVAASRDNLEGASVDETLVGVPSAVNQKGKGSVAQVDASSWDIAEDDRTTEIAGVTGKRKRIDDDENGGTQTSTNGPTGKTKKQKVEKPSKIDPEWLTCPVRSCKGGTDLGMPVGSREGAWELFV